MYLPSPHSVYQYKQGNIDNPNFRTKAEFFFENLFSDLEAQLQTHLLKTIDPVEWETIWKEIGSKNCKYKSFFISNFYSKMRWISEEKLIDDDGEMDFIPGQLYYYWIVFYLYFVETGIEYSKHLAEELKLIANITRTCFFWYPYDDRIIICEKPKEFFWNDEKEICGIEFNDGNGFYYLDGVRIPINWVKTNTWNWKAKWLLEVKNTEQKRLLIQILGYEKIITELGSGLIHKEIDNYNNMELIKIKSKINSLKDRRGRTVQDEDFHLLKVVCPSTDKIHILRVQPTMKTCEEARRWTLFDVKNQFNIIEET